MKLLYQTHSPFARKALVFAHEAGLATQLEVIHHETSPTNRNDVVFNVNPLGKVPVLLLETGKPIFDSGVICTFLDELHVGQKLIPLNIANRIVSLRLQAVADGISEAGIWARWESVRRPEPLRLPEVYEGMMSKVIEGYDYLENHMKFDGEMCIGKIAVATALSWLEFRDMGSFRGEHPNLTAWYDTFSDRPSMKATELSGDTHD